MGISLTSNSPRTRASRGRNQQEPAQRPRKEAGACEGKLAIATRAKQLGYDAIHDTVHEMAKDEARHGAGFLGLYNRYFKK